MQRGSRSLFTDMFPQDAPLPKVPNKKSRNPELQKLRNEFVLTRFYYYSNLAKVEKRTYAWVMTNMRRETFLEQATIVSIINLDKSFLRQLRDSKKTNKELQHKYPWIIWREAEI